MHPVLLRCQTTTRNTQAVVEEFYPEAEHAGENRAESDNGAAGNSLKDKLERKAAIPSGGEQ
jgi:hypothetical protein